MSLNQVNIMGRIGKDPEVRYTQNGTAVATFSVATTEKFTDQNGQKREETEWHRVVFWGKRAETIGQYFKKGDPIYVSGKLKTREWEDKNGNRRSTTEIVGTDFIFPPGKSNQGQQAAPFDHGRQDAPQSAGGFSQPAPQQTAGGIGAPPVPPSDQFDDDVPF